MKVGLIAREPVSALGVAAMLDLERIPYTRRESVADTPEDELALFAGEDATASDAAALVRRPSVVLCGGGTFVAEFLGSTHSLVQPSAVRIPMDEAIWRPRTRALVANHGVEALRIPLAPVCATDPGRSVEILGKHLVGDASAARLSIARVGPCVWSATDLGTAFVNLTQERYEPPSPPVHAPGRFRRLAETVYYQLPEWMRRPVQRAAYAMLERRLEELGPSHTEYPVEASGFLLVELMRELLLRTGTPIARLARWPAPFESAAAMTHDIEPSRFSYGDGLDALLDRADESEHPATFGLVAEAAQTRLRDDQIARLAKHEVVLHGRTHRGDPVDGRERVRSELTTARSEVESRLQRPVSGYRSPRLDRSADLAWALDRSSFAFDSSWPDVDRENVVHFGAGVGLNLPFRPLVEDDDGRLRPSRCLELPLTAPDCIQPLLGGSSVLALRNTVATKAAFVRAAGGSYVALVHAGVFGAADGERRMAHLDFVLSAIRREGVWLTSLAGLHQWWQARENVRIEPTATGVSIENDGTEPISGLRVILEQGEGTTEVLVAPIPAGGSVRIDAASNAVVTAA